MRWLLVALSAVVLLTPDGAIAGTSEEFYVKGTIHGEGAPDPVCRGFRYTHTGSLESSIGPVSWEGAECVDMVAEPGTFTITGWFSLGGGLVTGTFEASGRPDATGRVPESGTFEITGGECPYAGARGGGTITILAEPTASRAEVELTGTLHVPGS